MKVVALSAPTSDDPDRTGFMVDITIPDDFDQMGATETEALFGTDG